MPLLALYKVYGINNLTNTYRVSQNSRIPNSERCRDHFSSRNMEIKKNRDSPTKIHWSEGALFELCFLQIQAEKFSVYCYL
jgi:hypothetical protein